MHFKEAKLMFETKNKVKELEKLMATFQSDVDKLAADMKLVKEGIANLQAQINTLAAELANGSLTAAQQAALDAVTASADELVAALQPTPPAPPQAP